MAEVAAAKSPSDPATLQRRIDAMFMRDKFWAWGFVITLWITIGFVLYEVNSMFPTSEIRTVVWVAAIVLLLFNTASMAAMVRHYAHDKEHIYGIDIRHLDAGR
jgi:hypothetical protein